MSKTLLALVATKGSWTGPWQRSKGIERLVIVENLGDGEVIELEYQLGQEIHSFQMKSAGSFPFPECQRFRAIKISDSSSSPETNVKIDIGD